MKKIPKTAHDWAADIRFDKDGYAIPRHITKLDMVTFKLSSGPNPKFKPVSEGGEAEYEYGYMDEEEARKHLAKLKGIK